ncbi:glucose-6-phosphate dehydrogenase assembly protein OpcA [Nocardioides sp. HDW12B]|uniref:glucose-6-phosphate dehydrogenase assembly protein OpcA n=1 Tax=Nocardioides sp. HDW12B TaxID=2714939 RepID=UPI00140B56B2|nr:glucose-6-phosphate dehydrogenase assembly protein OpcA [Nocardioides sp. HDW12B]QIK66339.1 glucose-6-phosphate dehydrogenase assembly protein OpcA [Nocardioides sp. HDW12B]
MSTQSGRRGTVLEDTNASEIASAIVKARRNAGSPAMGMVMTMIVVVDQEDADAALDAARDAAREHPSRLLGLVTGSGRGSSRITAEIRTGSGTAGEQALITLEGPVTKHPDSVLLPLLLPDSPVVVWWPCGSPADPAADPVGQLGTRRITDAARAPTARARAMLDQCRSYAPGNTDLAWTRITPWRAFLAAALDQTDGRVSAVSVTSERVSPSADLLAAWLGDRLRVTATRRQSDGPGITEVVLTTSDGDVRLARDDGRHAVLSVPGQPDRPVALVRREIPALLTEELRRLDPDDVYARTVKRLTRMSAGRKGGAAQAAKKPAAKRPAAKKSTKKTATKKTATKKTATKKTATKKTATKKTATKKTATKKTAAKKSAS